MTEQPQTIDTRVRLAMDVIEQLDAKRFIAAPGVYLRLADDTTDLERWSLRTELAETIQVQDVLRGKTCAVCGIGALFVARVDRFDALTMAEMHGVLNRDGEMRAYLAADFDLEQLALVETAFEGDWILDQLDPDITHDRCGGTECWEDEACDDCVLRGPFKRAVQFYSAHGGRLSRDCEEPHEAREPLAAERRLRAIMTNIIANGGRFNP